MPSATSIDSAFRKVSGSKYTDITGALIQGAEFLNEGAAGTKTIIIFSDMQEELDKVTVRSFPISLKNIRIVAVNVVKLRSDNIDPRRYLGRLDEWKTRVVKAGAVEWQVVNDLDHLSASSRAAVVPSALALRRGGASAAFPRRKSRPFTISAFMRSRAHLFPL